LKSIHRGKFTEVLEGALAISAKTVVMPNYETLNPHFLDEQSANKVNGFGFGELQGEGLDDQKIQSQLSEEFGPLLHGGKELERKFRVNQPPRVRIKRDQNRGPTHFLGRGH